MILQGTAGRATARLRGQAQYSFVLVAANDKGEEVRSEPVVVEATCRTLPRVLLLKCNRNPEVQWVGGN
jgi:hypothetical protein